MLHSMIPGRCRRHLGLALTAAVLVGLGLAPAGGAVAQTRPEATQPEATQPEATQPEATQPEATRPAPSVPQAAVPAVPQREALPSFSDLAKSQLETVVNISSTQATPEEGPPLPGLPDFPPGSPFEEFFRQFRDRQSETQRPISALGSGFIIDSEGYIVTNGHVVQDADEINVILHDGTRLEAKVVGVDPPTDLALVKVDAGQPLPVARWGDSETVEIGDWVLAIGNPFGLGGTVTSGILSARARDIQQGPYDEFLQTDASINRGNSGGPLFNMAGEVIGVNTAIYSPTGGNVGIGFAIPSSLARPVIAQLREEGRVRRGWLGVQVQRVTPEIAEGLGLEKPEGALVTAVTPGGPAERAGLRQGDVIVGFGGQPVEEMRELPRIVATTEIGSRVDVRVWRGGQEQTVPVTVGELETDTEMAAAGSTSEVPAPENARTVLGLTLAPLSQELRDSFQIGEEVKGVVVTDVTGDSAAAERGIDPGDVIVEAAQEPVTEPEDVAGKVKEAKEQGRKTVLMLVSRDGDLRYVPVPVEGGPRG